MKYREEMHCLLCRGSEGEAGGRAGGYHWHSIVGFGQAAESELRELPRPEEPCSPLWANLIAHLENIHSLPPSPMLRAHWRSLSREAGPGASTGRLGKSPRCQPTGPCCSLQDLIAQVPHIPAPGFSPYPFPSELE